MQTGQRCCFRLQVPREQQRLTLQGAWRQAGHVWVVARTYPPPLDWSRLPVDVWVEPARLPTRRLDVWVATGLPLRAVVLGADWWWRRCGDTVTAEQLSFPDRALLTAALQVGHPVRAWSFPGGG